MMVPTMPKTRAPEGPLNGSARLYWTVPNPVTGGMSLEEAREAGAGSQPQVVVLAAEGEASNASRDED